MKQKGNGSVLVIGGGASGLTAAIYAARCGADVTILEHNEKSGKKILVTGNGKCNITNKKMGKEFYFCENPEFAAQVLEQFSLKETESFFEEMGIVFTDRNGYMYPASGQASSVSNVLETECLHLGVKIFYNTHVKTIKKKDTYFVIESIKQEEKKRKEKKERKKESSVKKGTENAEEGKINKIQLWKADAVILSAGSKAAKNQGSDGSGYELARMLGHKIITPLPALVQLRTNGQFLKEWSGVRTDAKIRLLSNGKEIAADRGEVQLTDYGISGIPVFQVSRFASRELENHNKVEAILDFIPDKEEQELNAFLEKRAKRASYKTMQQFMIGMLHEKVITVILECAGIAPDSYYQNLKPVQKYNLIRGLKQFRLSVIGVNSFEQAQTCTGGVSVEQIHPNTMESILVKSLYLTGELIDVDGICGGYNLQWAWSTGAIAGRNAAKAAALGHADWAGRTFCSNSRRKECL